MLEIKITLETAVVLLTERMDYEFAKRLKIGIIPAGSSLKNLSYRELVKRVDVAVFDLICLLPVELLLDKTNLTDLVTKAVHSLARIYSKEEFKLYTKQKADRLIKPVVKLVSKSQYSKSFLNTPSLMTVPEFQSPNAKFIEEEFRDARSGRNSLIGATLSSSVAPTPIAVLKFINISGHSFFMASNTAL